VRPYGNALGFWFFHLLIRLGGVRAAYGLLWLVLPYYGLFRPSAAASIQPYLKRRFPGRGYWGLKLLAIQHLAGFSKVMIDQAATGILGPKALKVDFPQEQELYSLSAKRQGLLLLTTHLGSWMSAQASLDHMAGPVYLMMDREQMAGRHFFELAGIADRFRFISPRGPMGGLLEALSTLKAGECISIMGDRTLGPGRQRQHAFMGGVASFPASPYYLASAAGAEVVMLLARRSGPMQVEVQMTVLTHDLDLASMGREQGQEILLGRYLSQLEGFLKLYPHTWYNFSDFWQAETPAQKTPNLRSLS
jgi:predicted LPLAT superfamily acyltransferase